MTFIKGESGNPMGRPKGSLNRNTAHLRELISGFLNSNFETVTGDFEALQPKDRIKYYCELLQFGLPKLQTTVMESRYDSLPEDQIDEIITGIINNKSNN